MAGLSSKLAFDLTSVQWMRQSNSFDQTLAAEWTCYSDVENLMIEEAYQAKQLQIIFDKYAIDFKANIQISSCDKTKTVPIKRVVGKIECTTSRQDHYTCDPVTCEHSFGGQYGWIPPFIKEITKELALKKNQLPSRDPSVIPMIVEKAARGIIEEGTKVGKINEAKWMAKKLLDRKDDGVKEVWKCCANLYSLESFLYIKLNATMRFVGSNQHEEMWRSKVRTLGPFCLLLWDDPINKRATTKADKKVLYRGTNLTETQIDSYRKLCQRPDKYGSFQSFTSSSRNLKMVEKFLWNVVFIMEITFAFTADIQNFSEFPNEEEELIYPGVCFTVERVEYDESKKKHLIYLNLIQRFNKSSFHEISANQQQALIDSDCYGQHFYAARRASVAAATIDGGHLDRNIYVRDYSIDE